MLVSKIRESELKINQVFNTFKNYARALPGLCTFVLLFSIFSPSAYAQVIDDIDITEADGKVEIKLHFITPIRYDRTLSMRNGDIRIYVKLRDIKSNDPRLTKEVLDSPPSDIIWPFTVTYPELDSSLTVSFLGKRLRYRVSAGHDGRSISITTGIARQNEQSKAIIKPSPVVPPVAVVAIPDIVQEDTSGNRILTPEEIELEAKNLLAIATGELKVNQIDKSVTTLNKLLNLPPNTQTQAAQKMMGEAREKNGELSKARAEYELYLKLYPKADDVREVKARLAKLPKSTSEKRLKGEPSKAEQKALEEKLQLTGGVSQNYFWGTTHTDTFAIDGAGNTSTFSSDNTDQKQLITSIDLTARKRTETLDSRFVLREYNRQNFLPGQNNENRWNALYIEQSARDRKFMYRLGRQSGSWGGLPGRFDGLTAGYSLNQTWRVNVAAGTPVEYFSGGWDPGDRMTFSSMSVELTRLPNEWSGSAYLLYQGQGQLYPKSGGIHDRAVMGLEAHYFEQRRNYMMQIEYDRLFRKFNMATFQGNWTLESGENYYVMLDHRRSPPLAFNMQGQFSQSVNEVLNSGVISTKTLRDNAVALSMISNMAAVGVSRQVHPKLRLSSDFRLSNSGGTGEYTTTPTSTSTLIQPGAPGSGNQYALSIQAMGNNLLFENDLGIANATFTKSDTTTGQSLTFSQVNTFNTRWRLDLSLMLYRQTDSADTKQTQIRPSVTVNYRLNNEWNFVGEAGIEQYRTSSTLSNDKTQRKYVYFGYRWNFR